MMVLTLWYVYLVTITSPDGIWHSAAYWEADAKGKPPADWDEQCASGLSQILDFLLPGFPDRQVHASKCTLYFPSPQSNFLRRHNKILAAISYLPWFYWPWALSHPYDGECNGKG